MALCASITPKQKKLRWITRWYFSFEKEFVQPPWILGEWDLEVHGELLVQMENEGHKVCKFHCYIKGPLAMMYTFPWEGHTQHARWDWSLFLASPNFITFLFIMYFGRFLIVGLPRIYTYFMLLMYFYFFLWLLHFQNKLFCTMKNSEHNRHNSLSIPRPLKLLQIWL
jgi:hypothetical protein